MIDLAEQTTVLKGGMVVLPGCVKKIDLVIKGERIEALVNDFIMDETADCRIIDVSGKVILPGIIDTHVHMWDPSPFNYREDWYSGSQCAAEGGITTIVDMPLSVPPVVDRQGFGLKYETANRQSFVDFAFWGGLTPGCLDQMEELNNLGCVAYKGFMSFANPDYPQITDGYLVKGMEIARKFDGLIGVHAENAEVADFGCRWLAEMGECDPARYDDARPWWVELEAIQRACLFSRAVGNRLYICHMTIAQGAEFLKQEKCRGPRVYVETCPQYLLFDRNVLRSKGAYAKCNPPLRSRENVEKLWNYVMDGTIDTIGSDHGPYRDEEKTKEGDFFKELCGFGGFDGLLPSMLTEGVNKRGLPLERLADLTSGNAAKIMGLYPKKGSLLPGTDADIVVVDLNEEWTFDGKKSFSKTKSDKNVYHGMDMKGRVKQTWVRGKLVYRDGSITGKAGYGQYVPRQSR